MNSLICKINYHDKSINRLQIVLNKFCSLAFTFEWHHFYFNVTKAH